MRSRATILLLHANSVAGRRTGFLRVQLFQRFVRNPGRMPSNTLRDSGKTVSLCQDSFHLCEDPSIDAIAQSLPNFDCPAFHTLPHRGAWVHMHAGIAAGRRYGSFGAELPAGMAIRSLLTPDPSPRGLAGAVQFPIPTQRPPVPTSFGSAGLTTGICLEALARFSAAAPR
jgi:hypothetical protein